MLKKLLTGAFCVGMTFAAMAGTAGLSVGIAENSPKIDGILDDPCWKNAWQSDNFYLFGQNGKQTDSTTVKLSTDNKFLYLGFTCKNPNIKYIPDAMTQRDDQITNDDSVEIFIDPGTGSKKYFHYALNFKNTKFDQMCKKSSSEVGKSITWDSPWYSATKVQNDSWTAEVALPLYILKSSYTGKPFKINICRNYSDANIDAAKAYWGKKQISSCIAPVKRGFHEPENFTELNGLDINKFKPVTLPMAQAVKAMGYSGSGKQLHFPVNTRIINHANKAGTINITVTDIPEKGKSQSITQKVTLPPYKEINVNITVPTKHICPRRLKVRYSIDDNKVGDTIEVKDKSELNIFGKVLSKYAYYLTSENNAFFKWKIGFPAATLKNYSLKIKLGNTIISKTTPTEKGIYPLPLKKLALGTNTLHFELWDKNTAVKVEKLTVIKTKPATYKNVRVNFFKRYLEVDGKPFFCHGLICHNIDKNNSVMIKNLAATGMNTIWNTPDFWKESLLNHPERTVEANLKIDVNKSLPEFMAKTSKNNLKVITWPLGRQPIPLKGTWKERVTAQRHRYNLIEPLIKEQVTLLSKHTNFLGFLNIDEPNLLNPLMRLKVAEWYKETVSKLDPFHPLFETFARHIPQGEKWMDIADIFHYDVYQMMGWEGMRGDLDFMVSESRELEKRCRAANKVMYMMPIATGLEPARSPRGLTYQQQLCQNLLAIICGAKGLNAFYIGAVYNHTTPKAYLEISKYLNVMAPAILDGDIEQNIAYKKPTNLPGAYFRIFRSNTKSFYLIAASSRLYPIDAAISLPGQNIKRIEGLFGTETPALQGNSFTTDFMPHGTKAWHIILDSKVPIPAKLNIALTHHRNKQSAPPSLNLVIENSMKQKNRCPNADFNDQVIPGTPDFYQPYSSWSFDLGQKGSAFYIDPAEKFEGRNSMRISSELLPGKDPNKYNPWRRGTVKTTGMVSTCYPDKEGGIYTLSVYMKAKEPGTKVTFRGKVVAVSDKWERYVFPKINIRKNRKHHPLYIHLQEPGKTIWINGPQIEKGDKATEFDYKPLKNNVIPEDKDNLIQNGHAEYGDTRGWHRGYGVLTNLSGEAHSGNYAFMARSINSMYSDEFIPLKPNTNYELSGTFKAAGKGAKVIYGLIYFDENKKRILHHNLFPIKGTATTLVSAAAKGDTIIKVSNAATWLPDSGYVAFGTDKNMPFFNVTPIAAIEKNGNSNIIRLRKQLKATIPAGTQISQTKNGSHGSFLCINVPLNWKTFSKTITHRAINAWHAKYAKVAIIIQGDYKKFKNVFSDDLSMKEQVKQH